MAAALGPLARARGRGSFESLGGQPLEISRFEIRRRTHAAGECGADKVRIRESNTERCGYGAEHSIPYVDVLGFTNAEWGGDDSRALHEITPESICPKGTKAIPEPGRGLGLRTSGHYEDDKGKGATILHPPETYAWACEMKVTDPMGTCSRFGSDPKEDA